ncbi:hypothetical protein GF362_05565 [Candidatus Dojkabacteria bacterium]|nr:hypothetical protein [Candidatus Dojkabacteria bacterium]
MQELTQLPGIIHTKEAQSFIGGREAICAMQAEQLKPPSERGYEMNFLGDIITDGFAWGRHVGRCREGGPNFLVESPMDWCLGGGGNVLSGLANNYGQVHAFSVVGNSPKGLQAPIVDLLSSLPPHVHQDGIIFNPDQPIVMKTRIIGPDGSIIRTDDQKKWGSGHSPEYFDALLQQVQPVLSEHSAPLTISDYGRGTVTPQVLQAIGTNENAQRSIWVDPRGKFNKYSPISGMTLFPNRNETMEGLEVDLSMEDPVALAEQIKLAYQRLDRILPGTNAVFKLDQDGIFWRQNNGEILHSPSFTGNTPPLYPSGCGDAVITAIGLADQLGIEPESALIAAGAIGGAAAGIPGTKTLNSDLLNQALCNLDFHFDTL